MNVIGSVVQIIGKVVAIKPDGSERLLALGDPVYADEVIKASPGASVELSMADGAVVALEGGETWLLSSETYATAESFDSSEAAADGQSIQAAITGGEPGTDAEIDAIQAAILAGADPTEVGEATAAGGAPAAGGGQGNEGSSTVNILRTAEEVDPTAGYDTIGYEETFIQPEEELVIVPEPLPVVSVSVEVSLETPTDPSDPDVPDTPTPEYPVLVSGNAVSILEGSDMESDKTVTFNLVLDKAFDQDVTVTYQLYEGTALYGEDWSDGPDPDHIYTVVIPAGTTEIPVTVYIVQDKLDEGNETLGIRILSAENATVNPASDSGTITIYDDDTTPVAQDDFNSVMEDTYNYQEEEEYPSTSGNVISGVHDDSSLTPAEQEDTDADGDSIVVVSFSDADETAAPGETITGDYGTLTLYADGSYTYVLTSNGEDAIQGLSEGETLEDVFSYVITDTYNAEQTADLTITIEGKDDGVELFGLSGEGAEEVVYENDLEEGSSPDAPSLTQDGDFSFDSPDGLATITIGGQAFTLAQLQALNGSSVTISSDYGDLELNGFSGDEFGGIISYSYTLTDNVDNDSQAGATDGGYTDSFAVELEDDDGSYTSASLDIDIVDDTPTAADDGPSGVTEDGTSMVSGNVLDNDDANADQSAVFVDWSGADNTAALDALATYGTLTLNGDGTWDYTLDNSLAATQALTSGDNLSYDIYYTMADADGDEDVAKLNITITGADDNASVDAGAGETVYEAGLPDGSANDDSDLVIDGSLSVSASDGISTVTIGGTVFTLADLQSLDGSDTVNTGQGVLTIKSYSGDAFSGTITYDYALSATIDNDSAAPSAPETVDGSSYLDVVAVEVDGVGGSNGSDNLEISIVDDTPTAADDGPSGVTEDGTSMVSGNVLDNDDANADQSAVFVDWSGADNTAALDALATYGTLTLNGDGTWDYTLDNSLAATQALTSGDNLSYDIYYTMADADGDEDVAKLNITITGADDNASVDAGAGETVYEAGLPDGSANDDSDLVIDGSLSVSASDGISTVTIGGTVFTLADLQSLDGSDTVNTGQGILTIKSYSGTDFSGTITYDYALSATIDNDSAAPSAPETVDGSSYLDVVAVEVDGVGGSNGSDNLEISIVDDTPTAADDGPSGVTEDGTSMVSGNVLDNDDANADQSAVFVDWSGADNTAALDALATYGTLTLNGDGTWDYTLDNSLAATQALTSGDNLSYDIYYTMADADGDEDVAKLNITITGADDNASVDAGAGETVYEAGLPDGSANDDSDLVIDGSLSVSASDGISTVTIGGTVFTLADLQSLDGSDTVNTGQGILTIKSYSGTDFSGTITYDYALSATIDNDSAAPSAPETVDGSSYLDVVAVEVDGVGGSNGSDNLEISIVDDTPQVIDPETAFVINTTGSAGSTTGSLDIDGNIDDNVGADQLGTLSFATTNGSDSGFTSGGLTIYLYVSSDGQTLVGSTTEPDGVLDGDDSGVTDNQVFTVDLNTDGDAALSNDNYDFTLYQQVDGGLTTFSVSDAGFDFYGGNDPYSYFDDTITNDANGEQDILLTPMINGVDGGTTNTSNIAGGVGSGNSVGPTEGVRVDFVYGLTGNPAKNISDADYSNLINQDHEFDGHNMVNGASATFTGISGGIGTSDITITAFDDFDGDNVVGDSTDKDVITSVQITYNGETKTVARDTSMVTVAGILYTLDWDDDYSVTVEGVVSDTSVAVYSSDGGFSSVEYTWSGGETFKIGGFGAGVPTPGEVIEMSFDLQLVDADGDTVVMNDGIQVVLSPENHALLVSGEDGLGENIDASASLQAVTIVGSSGNNILIGSEGDDILVGLGGDDTLTGGDGLDRFKFVEEDINDGSVGMDTITDFDTSEGDILDVADLLGGITEDAATLDGYLHFELVGGDTVIHLNKDGDYTSDTNEVGKDEHTIVLQGVDLTAGETLSDAEILTNLLASNNLDTDV